MKLVFVFLLLLYQTPFQWSDKKLSVDDFKSEINKGATASSTTEIILIVKRDGKKIYYDTKSFFHPDQSFFSKSCRNPKYILQHEQLHFDITELYSRNVKACIKKYQGRSITDYESIDSVMNIYDSLIAEWNTMQNRYDCETEYSINVEEQIRWKLFIDGKNL